MNDEYSDVPVDTVTMQLNISAKKEGDLNSKVATEVGTNSEYMHNLCVLLVQEGKLVQKLLPDFSTNPLAKDGNLRVWLSDPFELKTGTYTIYAFANINTYYSEEWGSLTGLGEGTLIPEGIDHIVLDNPVSKIDFVNYFIPMSAKQEIIVTPETRNISIGLDRLISKVRTSITGKAGAQVTGLSFGGYADRVALFSDHTPEGITYSGEKNNVVIPENGLLVAEEGNPERGRLVIPDFYVNSSPAGHPFQVKITTDERGGAIYSAFTSRNELPRNSIFPLTLQLNYSDFNLDATCWVSPIGSLPVEVNVGLDPNTYEIKVPEGCQFAFTVSVNGGTDISDLTVNWMLNPDKVTGIAFEGATSEVTTLKGHVTASAGKTYNLQLQATWKSGSTSYNRTYTVKLTTADLTEFSFNSGNTQTRSTEFALDYLKPEILNLFVK